MYAADTSVTSTIFAQMVLGCKKYQLCGKFLDVVSAKLRGEFAEKNAEIAKLLQDLLKFLAKTYKKFDLHPKSYLLDR